MEDPKLKGQLVFILTCREWVLGRVATAAQVVGVYASLDGARADVKNAIDKANQPALSQHEKLLLRYEGKQDEEWFSERWGSDMGAMMTLDYLKT